eukprot:12133789-Ditylum_brightwellii.AAC.1
MLGGVGSRTAQDGGKEMLCCCPGAAACAGAPPVVPGADAGNSAAASWRLATGIARMVFLPLVLLLVLGVCLATLQRFVQRLSLWNQCEVQLVCWERLLEGQPCLESWCWDVHCHSLDMTVGAQCVDLPDHLVQGLSNQGDLMHCSDQSLCFVDLDQVLQLAKYIRPHHVEYYCLGCLVG